MKYWFLFGFLLCCYLGVHCYEQKDYAAAIFKMFVAGLNLGGVFLTMIAKILLKTHKKKGELIQEQQELIFIQHNLITELKKQNKLRGEYDGLREEI